MTTALEKLAYYFQTIGIASVALWMAALLLAAIFICGLRRTPVCWAALLLAIVAMVLANVNSNNVSAIKMDFSDDLQAARQRAAKETKADEEAKETEADEEAEEPEDGNAEEAESPTPNQEVDAGNAEDGNAEDGNAGNDDQGDEPSDDEPAYSYRQRGKADRTDGMKVEEQEKVLIATGTEDQPVLQNVRVMKPHEVVHANRLDRANLFFARSTLYLAVLLVVFDYFRRFNRTFESLFPLPIGGWLVDSLFPKTHAVCVGGARKGFWKTHLERVVRKGETFVYFGPSDPWTRARLGRLPLFPKAIWSLERITQRADNTLFSDEYLYESAWFGRYCFVIVDDGRRATKMLAALVDFLQLRHATRASARHTVNVVWDLGVAGVSETLRQIAPLCQEANVKLLVAADPRNTEALASCFDEVRC